MFWGNKVLEQRLPELIDPYNPMLLDRATYRLRIGPEVYVSPTGIGGDTALKTKMQLNEGNDFQIPPGQFALLITEERVTVPHDALAFISIRATYKFQGLVNVSGFHVDPGFHGRLIFSVFNAGPSAVHLEQGEDCFHMWFADLRDHPAMGEKAGYENIPPKLVKHIADGMQSFAGLNAKINETDKRTSDRIVAVEKEQILIRWAATFLLGIGVALAINQFAKPATPTTVVVSPAASPSATASPAIPSAQPGAPSVTP